MGSLIDSDFEIRSGPVVTKAYCPKHHNPMVELPNGWLNTCWYCKECDYVYHLRMMKMRFTNKDNLDELLKERGIKRDYK